MMIVVDGILLPNAYLPDFIWVEDIQYFEGTLLAEYNTPSGDVYVFQWCDCSQTLNRWLAVRTSKRSLYELTSGLISSRDFLTTRIHGNDIYLLDIDNNDEIISALLTSIENIADYYLPQSDVFILPELRPNTKNSYTVLIKDKWNESELSDFPRKFMDAYSIINKYVSTKNNQTNQNISTSAWTGGFSSMQFYTSLRDNLKRTLSLDAIQYASPGYFQFNADTEIGLLVKKNVDSYISSKDEIDTIFRELSIYLRENNLNDDKVSPDKAQEDWISGKAERLMSYFSEPSWEWLIENSPDIFRAVKISMSFYRRIKPLSNFVTADKATFGKM